MPKAHLSLKSLEKEIPLLLNMPKLKPLAWRGKFIIISVNLEETKSSWISKFVGSTSKRIVKFDASCPSSMRLSNPHCSDSKFIFSSAGDADSTCLDDSGPVSPFGCADERP